MNCICWSVDILFCLYTFCFCHRRVSSLYEFWKQDRVSVKMTRVNTSYTEVFALYGLTPSQWWKLWQLALHRKNFLSLSLFLTHTHTHTHTHSHGHTPPASSLGLSATSALCILSGFSRANLNDLLVDLNHLWMKFGIWEPLQDFPCNSVNVCGDKMLFVLLNSISCFFPLNLQSLLHLGKRGVTVTQDNVVCQHSCHQDTWLWSPGLTSQAFPSQCPCLHCGNCCE